jgi:hypothetical protein
MMLHNGDTVFVMCHTYGKLEGPKAWVTECVVIDAENKIVRENSVAGGPPYVRIISPYSSESIHATEAEAWQSAAAAFATAAENLLVKSGELAQKAASLTVGKAVPA